MPRAQSRIIGPWRQTTIRPKELRGFTRQLATLVKAGVPLARSLEVIGSQEGPHAKGGLAHELRQVIENGGTLSDGLRRYPQLFDETYRAMVSAGEASGALGDVLARQALVMEKQERIRARLRTALAYPAIVLVIAIGIVAILVAIVVPKFGLIYGGLLKGQPLPMLTQGLLDASRLARTHALPALTVLGGLGWLVRRWRRTQRGRRVLDRWALRIPVLGDLLLKTAVARVTGLMGALLEAGVPELEALSIAEDASGNTRIAEALGEVGTRLRRGEGLAGPLESTRIFPALVAGMVRVGEETGALAEMLRRVAEAYDDEVDHAVAALAAVVEPLLIVGMALVVGFIVIALFLPMVGVLQHLQ